MSNETIENTTVEKEFIKPRYEVSKEEGGHKLKVFMPGVSKDDVSVKMEGGKLAITGNRAEASAEWKPLRRELSDKCYRLELRLEKNSVDANNIKAAMEEGVLALELPKKAAEEPVAIAIS